ncbi:FG-GAP repeat domain-containing protein [Nocardiopsis dassonvillei]|uniref:FG-GAP repeat domain-containing protein n=1 Tax=Nocardiopsis dassonvillei TaxID=2014 RepID=UPI0033F48778
MAPRRLVLLPCVLLLSACGGAPGPGTSSETAAPEEVREYETAPVPEGEGGDVPDDVNGDGFADLLFATRYDPDPEAGFLSQRLMIVHGSPGGPDPATRTVWSPYTLLPALSPGTGGEGTRPGTADLDGDGFADIPVLVHADDELGVGMAASGQGPRAIVWGGPAGPDPRVPPTPIPIAAGEERPGSYTEITSGDFDGDRAPDLAVAETRTTGGASRLTVLYGPFDRDGSPARTALGAVDAWVGGLVAGPPSSDGGTSPLLVRHGDDGEQARNTLVVTAPGDPAQWETVELLAGSLAAFGDLDGDGETDLVLGDSGGRNNEPGFETEAPEVDRRVNVYPGPLTAEAADPLSAELPSDGPSPGYGADRAMAVCDLDGDGTDVLAVSSDGHGVDLLRHTGDGIEVDGAEPLVRRGPEDGPLATGDAAGRVAGLFSCADYDADGADELALAHDLEGTRDTPVRWWITGDGGEDEASFDSAAF